MATNVTNENFETYFTDAMKKYSESLESGAESAVIAFITTESAITNTMSLPGVEFNKKPVKDDGTVDPSATINRYIQIPWSVLAEALSKMNIATQAAGYVNAELNTETNNLTITNNKGTSKTVNVKGQKGDTGDKGDTGATPNLSIGTVSSGPSASASISGTAESPALNLTLPKGDKGDTGSKGDAATVDVGTTATGAPGSPAQVTRRGTTYAAIFDFTIPQGVKGDPGQAATIDVKSTATGAPGTQASVRNAGSTSAAQLEFTIPKGEKGDKGDTPVITADTDGTIKSDGVVVSTAIKEAAVYARDRGDYAKQKGDEASRVDADLDGTIITVTNRRGGTKTANLKGPKGDQGEGIDYSTMTPEEREELYDQVIEQINRDGGNCWYPVDMSTLTPESTFRKGSVLAINGVFYRATEDTGNFPVILVTHDREFVVNEVDGMKAYLVADPTIQQGWVLFTDASLSYWMHDFDSRLSDLAEHSGTITGIVMNGAMVGEKGIVNLGTVLTSHQDISGKADKSATVSTVAYDAANKKITKTINGTTSDVVTVSTLKTDLGLSKGDVGLGNVGNFKAVSTEASQGLSTAEKDNARANIGAGVGTITGIKMNGSNMGSSGVVDLGDVITSHQDISGKQDKLPTITTQEIDTLLAD